MIRARLIVWVSLAAFGLAACSGEESAIGLSDEQEKYLDSIAEVQGRVDSAFESVGETLAQTYNTREVLFGALRDVGYEGVGESALVLAQTITPPPEYEQDHERWLDHRRLAVELGPELTAALDNQNIREMQEVFSALFQDWAELVTEVAPEVCRTLDQDESHCPPRDDLPGGDYGVEVYEILRRHLLRTADLFDFFGDMSPTERSLRLDDVQPRIEESLRTGGDELRALDPPSRFEDDHRTLIEFFDEQYANAIAITEANSERDTARVLQLFDASNITFAKALDKLSADYLEIAAPFVGPDED